MTNTVEALGQFTQALGPMLSPPPDSEIFPHPEPAPTAAPGAAGEKSQTAAVSRGGITRQAPRGEWPRRASLAVLAVMLGLGFPRVVRATEHAAASYWHQQVGQSLASQRAPHRGHPSPHHAALRGPG